MNDLLKEPVHIKEERIALKGQQKIVAEAHGVLSRDIEIQMGEIDYELERALAGEEIGGGLSN